MKVAPSLVYIITISQNRKPLPLKLLCKLLSFWIWALFLDVSRLSTGWESETVSNLYYTV